MGVAPATIFRAMVLVLVVVVVGEFGMSRGPVVECRVEETLAGSKGLTAFARCDGVLEKIALPDIALTVHGEPGSALQVRKTRRGLVWDKPAAHHGLSLAMAPFFLLLSLVLWFKRNA